MQFITTGDRIATENFNIGDLYTITFTNGNYINSACVGIGDNYIVFQRNEPELIFTLSLDTAELVSSIELYAGGSGTNNYNELTNKPKINGVELINNISLSELGLGTAAEANTTDFATAAEGALADTAIQPADMPGYLEGKQDLIDSNNKLSADLVDDTNTTNKFATSEQLAQIETNKNNIAWSYTELDFIPTSAHTYEYTGISFTVPANTVFEFYAADRNLSSANDIFSTGIIVCNSASNIALAASTIAENTQIPSEAPNYWLRSVGGITPKRASQTIYYIWVSRTSTTANGRIILAYRQIII